MKENVNKKGASFFDELILCLQKENIEFSLPENNHLPILLDAREVGVVTAEGAMRVRKEYIDAPEAREVYHRAWAAAEGVQEYLSLMRNAPPLKADGLKDPYRKLADFNGCVLGGMESQYGVQFTTWQWTYERTGLTLGHYYGNDYVAAKQDFAIRSGLVNKQRIFSKEQLTEMYRCIADMLEAGLDLSYEREKAIEGINKQIRELVPDVTEQIEAGLEPEMLSPTM